ncbi:MAG TPA: GH25 family lysozyme [Sphingomonas sp.]|nr:GH25 family lysozyme [Sphingomonas sp.]
MRVLRGRAGVAGVILVVLAIGAIILWTRAVHWRPDPATFPIQGLHVSAAQGEIAWNTVAAHEADFAYIRATDGATRDPRFAINWKGAAEAGLRRGAIHSWSFCTPARVQANAFVTTVPRSRDALPAVLDLDFSEECATRPDRAQAIAGIETFLRIAETHTGEPMLLKISKAVAKAYQPARSFARPIWSARLFFAPDYAARPWRVWQASDIRRIDGVDGPVAWDVVAP